MEEMDAGHKRLESFPKVEIPVGWGSHVNGGRDIASSSSSNFARGKGDYQDELCLGSDGKEPNERFGHGESQWGEYFQGMIVDRVPPPSG